MLLAAVMCLAATAAHQSDRLIKIPASAAPHTAIDHPSTVEGVLGGAKTQWRELLQSADKKFSAGIYKSEAVHEPINAYPNDEFMYFIGGSVTLTSSDGTITKAAAGDAITIKKGWTGRWDSDGYIKYYVSYDAK